MKTWIWTLQDERVSSGRNTSVNGRNKIGRNRKVWMGRNQKSLHGRQNWRNRSLNVDGQKLWKHEEKNTRTQEIQSQTAFESIQTEMSKCWMFMCP